ncbi:MAG TPA: glycosyltransferase [Roseiflexaceae bacterium]|nr:glycosyltransferase [Roseiflexaceae bacterium]
MASQTYWKNDSPRWIRTPALVADVELTDTLTLPSAGADYRAARLLVRVHGRPVGYADVAADLTTPIDLSRILAALDSDATERALGHLTADLIACGLPAPANHTDLAAVLQQAAGIPCAFARSADGPHATVAVCTRDRAQLLGATLDSLLCQTYRNKEILVVDNAPSDDAAERLVRGHYPGVRYVREDRPGLDWARNRAIVEASGEFIAYVDDDAIADPAWLAGLITAFDTPEVMCVTGLVVPARLATPAQELFERFGFSMSFDRRRFYLGMQSPRPGFPFKGFAGTGCNCAFRRDVFDRIGLFDVHLDVGTPVPGGGDLDMFARVILAGYTLIYDPAPLIFHDHIADMKRLIDKMGQYHTANIAYLTKHVLSDPVYAPMILRYLLRTYVRTTIRGLGAVLFRRDRPLSMVLRQASRAWLGPLALYRSHQQTRVRWGGGSGAAPDAVAAVPARE